MDEERRHPVVRDAWLPALAFVLGALELASLGTPGWGYGVLVEAAAAGILVLRRQAPLLAGTTTTVLLLSTQFYAPLLEDASIPLLFWAIAIYALGRHVPDLRGLVGVAVICGMVFADFFVLPGGTQGWPDVVFVLSLVAPPYVLGRITRKLAVQAEQLARQQELIHDQAVQGERDRIARELHDVIAHSVSAMVVQTSAAQEVLETQPARAAELLQSVADTGRAALAETGRLLHLVRDEAGELGRSPAPSARDVPELVESFRNGGLDVTMDYDLGEVPLSGGVDVSVYRVVQEALTNAMKHAAGPVHLRLAHTPDCLRIRCTNPVGGPSLGGSGLGLQGIAERVAMLGGRMESAVTPQREFVLEVVIPRTRGEA